MRPPTDDEMNELPQIIVTADCTWDPSILDCVQDFDNMDDLPPENPFGHGHPFDHEGNFWPTQVFSLDIGDGDYVEMEFENFVDQSIMSVRTRARDAAQDLIQETVPDPKTAKEKGEPPPGEPPPIDQTKPATQATDVLVKGRPFDLSGL